MTSNYNEEDVPQIPNCYLSRSFNYQDNKYNCHYRVDVKHSIF